MPVILSLAIAAPPDLNDPVAPSPDEAKPEPSLDCMIDGCDETETDAPRESAEDLKTQARALVAVGKNREAIDVFVRAYDLAPGDHIIAFEIGSAAWSIRDCDKARTYFAHFVRYADSSTFPNKVTKAARTLDEIERTRCLANDQEVSDALRSGAPPKSPNNKGDGLVIGGAVVLGLGILALASGIVLIALAEPGGDDGPNCTVGQRCGNTCIAAHLQCQTPTSSGSAVDPDKLIAGAVLTPVGIGLGIGGIVMIVRGNEPRYITFTPTGLSIRF